MPRTHSALSRVFLHIVFCLVFCMVLPVCPAEHACAAPAEDQSAKADAPAGNSAEKAAEDGGADAAAEKKEEADPWLTEWQNQNQQLDDIIKHVNTMNRIVPGKVKVMLAMLAENRLEMRRLFVLGTTYSKDPRVLESIAVRIEDCKKKTRDLIAPTEDLASEVGDLKKQIETFTNIASKAEHLSEEMRAFGKKAETAGKKLNELESRINTALQPARDIIGQMDKATEYLNGYLPKLWSEHYVRGPQDYWSLKVWKDIIAQWDQTRQKILLRLPLELPTDRTNILIALRNAALALLVCGMLSLVLWRKIRPTEKEVVLRHIFRVSIPWLTFGFVLLASSWGLNNLWHLLMALGNLVLIIGQVSLAWDFRRMYDSSLHDTPSPMWGLVPLTLSGYLLTYPNIPLPLVNVIWIVFIILFMIYTRLRPDVEVDMQPGKALMSMQPFFLWLCLLLAVLGLPTYSMILYMMYLSITIAIQLSLGSMQIINKLSERLPQTGLKSAVGSLAIALAAPAVLILVMAGMSLWICTLPGGYTLVTHYASASVGVGDSNFSLISILMLISFFYVTRAVISLGNSIIASLSKHADGRIDSTLIPPMQTALTYAAWALFGLSVLKTLGLELNNLAMIASGLSVGIGFGMQNIISNFLSGLILIFSRTLQEGDIIDVGSITGTVKKISVRATMVQTFDNATIYVPNSEFISNKLINWTRNGRDVRREITVGVAYGSDTKTVMKLMREAASAADKVLKYPVPVVIFKDFGSSTLDFILRYWVRDFNDGVPTDSAIRLDIEQRFAKAGIEIAFPQMDLHIKDQPHHAVRRTPPSGRGMTTARVRRVRRLTKRPQE